MKASFVFLLGSLAAIGASAKPRDGKCFTTSNRHFYRKVSSNSIFLGVCMTDRAGKWGGSPNTECTPFPFTHEGKVYNGCSNLDNDQLYWCKTVDNNWGDCRDDCQLHHDVAGKKYTWTMVYYMQSIMTLKVWEWGSELRVQCIKEKLCDLRGAFSRAW